MSEADRMRPVYNAAMAYLHAHDWPVIVDATSYIRLLDCNRALADARNRAHDELIDACRAVKDENT
jgi:hypothetical protein